MSDSREPTAYVAGQKPEKKGMSTGCIIALVVAPLLLIITIAILASIAVPVYNGITQRAEQTKALSNAKQVALGIKLYALENGDKAPPSLDALVEGGHINGDLLQFAGRPLEMQMEVPPGTVLKGLDPSSRLLTLPWEDGSLIEILVDGSGTIVRSPAEVAP